MNDEGKSTLNSLSRCVPPPDYYIPPPPPVYNPVSKKDRKEIEANAILTYGKQMQEDMAIEEMSELIKVLIKNRRLSDKKALGNVLEEMADVQIMLEQLRLIFGSTKKIEWYKLNRLKKRLEEKK
ncbi:hypothetical protein [Caproicibacterium sp. BJN0003]|uniref:hypothetical protein n=1 Tax=Caproicibacterium sp. BJN0003 TaxID=2994078 RepID=UPI002250A5C0|nr:hypothetical protein [Caproicibacterium sp. BJN0003]UZT82132.1 hypothetical protein OP489_11800 [Caproicibacterium sp. BJN0003]